MLSAGECWKSRKGQSRGKDAVSTARLLRQVRGPPASVRVVKVIQLQIHLTAPGVK
jgi:hypothetical protein